MAELYVVMDSPSFQQRQVFWCFVTLSNFNSSFDTYYESVVDFIVPTYTLRFVQGSHSFTNYKGAYASASVGVPCVWGSWCGRTIGSSWVGQLLTLMQLTLKRRVPRTLPIWLVVWTSAIRPLFALITTCLKKCALMLTCLFRRLLSDRLNLAVGSVLALPCLTVGNISMLVFEETMETSDERVST